jgi:hypothetical protein
MVMLGHNVSPACAINENPDGPELFALASSWLSTCTQSHAACDTTSGESFLPSRLIDIGPNDGSDPRLINTNGGIDISDNRYFALSHCWGTLLGREVPKTTRAVLEEHKKKISLQDLSKTFRDAIVITRRLGLRYIWIDSLCIVQDDPQEFEVECGRMGLIYARSYCTISVSCHNRN